MEKQRKGKSIILSCILLLAAALLSGAARVAPGFAQWYSITVYPLLQGSIGRLIGLLPFSAAQALCCLLVVMVVFDIIATVSEYRSIRANRGVRSWKPFITFIRHIFVCASILIFLYAANCGVNYYRTPFIDPAKYQAAEFTERDLEEFCAFTADKLQENYSGGKAEYPDRDSLAGTAVEAMKNIGSSDTAGPGENSFLAGFYPRPKQLTVLSGFFSMMGVSGIYSPFTIEANINGEMPDMEKPFTACHELSHLKGFMNEGEANYIGWLACINSDDKAFNRSGWLIAWIYAGNSLFRIDPDRYYELREELPRAALIEIADNNEFWASRENKASEIQDRVNDAYLKSNGQKEGIRAYGQLTTLMLMWFSEMN